MSQRRAIISFANQRGNYYKGLDRLGASLDGRTLAEFFPFRDEHTVGAPLHLDNPYAFKLYCFKKVFDLGYTSVLWLDASVVAVRNIDHTFEEIEKNGYIMQEAGCYAGQWTNDEALRYFGMTREEAMKVVCYGNAGFLGLSILHPISRAFFSMWWDAMKAGAFKGSWKDHRHDLSCGSIIAHRLGMKLQSGNEWLDYADQHAPPKNDTIIFHAKGL